MTSIWERVRGLGADGNPVFEAIDDAAVTGASPWRPSKSLPLEEVDFNTPISNADVANNQWPPPVTSLRADRLQLYHELGRGQLDQLIDTRQLDVVSVGPFNIFRRIKKFSADMLIRSAPTTGVEEGPVSDEAINHLAYEFICDQIEYGSAAIMVIQTEAGPIIRNVDPRTLYKRVEGGYIVASNIRRPTTGATPIQPNAIQMLQIEEDGRVAVFVLPILHTVGGVVTTGQPVARGWLGQAAIYQSHSTPLVSDGTWGTSWYEDLMTVAVQLSRRFAAITRVLDGAGTPLLLLQGDIENFTNLPGVASSLAGNGSSGSTTSRIQLAKKLAASGALVADQDIQDAKFVAWDAASVEQSVALLQKLDESFRLMSGLPAALQSTEAIPSGISLRRMFWQYDAALAPVFNSTKMVLEKVLKPFGVSLEWEYSLEEIEETPMGNAVEDVEDEATARRGENDGSDG